MNPNDGYMDIYWEAGEPGFCYWDNGCEYCWNDMGYAEESYCDYEWTNDDCYE